MQPVESACITLAVESEQRLAKALADKRVRDGISGEFADMTVDNISLTDHLKMIEELQGLLVGSSSSD